MRRTNAVEKFLAEGLKTLHTRGKVVLVNLDPHHDGDDYTESVMSNQSCAWSVGSKEFEVVHKHEIQSNVGLLVEEDGGGDRDADEPLNEYPNYYDEQEEVMADEGVD
jgi:hypothetical protein